MARQIVMDVMYMPPPSTALRHCSMADMTLDLELTPFRGRLGFDSQVLKLGSGAGLTTIGSATQLDLHIGADVAPVGQGVNSKLSPSASKPYVDVTLTTNR